MLTHLHDQQLMQHAADANRDKHKHPDTDVCESATLLSFQHRLVVVGGLATGQDTDQLSTSFDREGGSSRGQRAGHLKLARWGTEANMTIASVCGVQLVAVCNPFLFLSVEQVRKQKVWTERRRHGVDVPADALWSLLTATPACCCCRQQLCCLAYH